MLLLAHMLAACPALPLALGCLARGRLYQIFVCVVQTYRMCVAVWYRPTEPLCTAVVYSFHGVWCFHAASRDEVFFLPDHAWCVMHIRALLPGHAWCTAHTCPPLSNGFEGGGGGC